MKISPPALWVCVSALAACGGEGGGTDIESTLVFAERTDAEIVRLINAAAGTEMFAAESQFGQFGDTFEADPCPTVTVEGKVATVTSSCTRLDGTAITGSATATNPVGWDQVDYDFSEDTLYEANQLAFTGDTFSQTFDGFIRRSDGLATWDADITVFIQDVGVRSDLYYHCTNPSSPRCALGGSGIELVGVGGARVSGAVTIDRTAGTQRSDFTLQGSDRLVVHSEGSCVAWSIEGTDRGMTCP